MEIHKIHDQKVGFYGKNRGSNSNKWNRVTKLAKEYNNLYTKFMDIAYRGSNSNTFQYRCAVATLLLMETGIRIGNESSAEGYYTVPHPHAKNQESKFVKTYGLTTLLKEHLQFSKNGNAHFNFCGKKQVDNTFLIPQKLRYFVIDICIYCEEDPMFGINDYQLTKFIKKYVGKQFTPKDFRTLRANIYAWQFINEYEEPQTKKESKLIRTEVAEQVAEKLNNTKGVCLKSYIDAELFNDYLIG